MSWLVISVSANVLLVLIIALIIWRRGQVIREHKLATFGYMLGALAYGQAHKDSATRYERLAFALKPMFGDLPEEEIRWRLTRSALIGYLGSKEPALVDVVDEKGRLLILQQIKGDEKAEEVWEYIDGALAGKDGFVEPTDRFSGEELKLGQLQLEAQLVQFYENALKKKKL